MSAFLAHLDQQLGALKARKLWRKRAISRPLPDARRHASSGPIWRWTTVWPRMQVSHVEPVQGGGYGSVPASNPIGPAGGQLLADETARLIEAVWS